MSSSDEEIIVRKKNNRHRVMESSSDDSDGEDDDRPLVTQTKNTLYREKDSEVVVSGTDDDSKSDSEEVISGTDDDEENSASNSRHVTLASVSKSDSEEVVYGTDDEEENSAPNSRHISMASDSKSDSEVVVYGTDDEEDISAPNSRHATLASVLKSDSEVIVSGTDDEEDGSSNTSLKSKTSEQIYLPETDEEQEEEEIEKKLERSCFSPRTRQSITGVWHKDSDDDDDDDSDDTNFQLNGSVSNKKNNEIVVSSDDDEVINLSNEITPPQQKNIKLIQTKITAFSPQLTKKTVSKKYHEDKLRERANLIMDTKQMVSLLNSPVGGSLPDKGASLSAKINKNEKELIKLNAYIDSLVVEDDQSANSSKRDSWSDLQTAIDGIKPVYTGKVGLNTFNTHKALTLDRLKQLHESCDNCPTEDTLADNPEGMRVTLMEHQRYALSWMMWREEQSPRGGILADDMGLGKTLSMIALILNKSQMDESSADEESENESEEEEGWAGKGRKADKYLGGTLIVCPASLINQWECEVKNRLDRNLLSVCVHHGTKRDVKPRILSKYHMVITTYAIVAREFKDKNVLFNIKWDRIILDEAHIIRNHKAQQSMACTSLKGTRRWALTGTPIQNKEMDLYALLKFLKCRPFDDFAVYKKWIGNQSAGAQERLNTLIKPLMLRRTKLQLQEKGELSSLPIKTTEIITVSLEKDEMNVYQKIMTFSRTLFAQFLHQRAERENNQYLEGAFMKYKDPNGAFHKMHEKVKRMHGQPDEIKSHQILTYLLRLRQICCHPGLIDKELEDEDATSEADVSSADLDLLEQLNKLKLDDSHETNDPNVSHENKLLKASSKVLLRTNPVFNLDRSSSKLTAAFAIIKDRVLDTNDKAVVISQWTSVLNLFANLLDGHNIEYVTLNGSTQVKNRNDIVVEFNNPKSRKKIMLLSLTAGGVGLNLIGGNHLLLLDPHWNPQLEAQAQDRIYRVGQVKPVFIYKLLCHETIEERIKVLQEKKLGIASDVLTGAKRTGGSKLTIDDMKQLFGFEN